MFRCVMSVVVGLLAAGCASTQLNHNTADLASSLGSLAKMQIFYNLAQALGDPDFVPSQVTLSIGTAQTSNAVNPSISIPLGPSFTTTNRFSSGRAETSQFTTQFVAAAPSLGVNVIDAWNQSWTMVPASSANQLRRLRALYQYATGTMPRHNSGRPPTIEEAEKQFLCEYPLQSLAVPASPPGENIAYRLDGCPGESAAVQGRIRYGDPTFTQGPNCVVCVDDLKAKMPRLRVNPSLRYAFIHDGGHRTDGMAKIGSHATTDFYVCKTAGTDCPLVVNQEPFDGRRAFSDFTLFVYEAMSVPSSGSGSGKSTGGSFVYSVR